MPDVKHTCMHCGGEVGEDGYAESLEPQTEGSNDGDTGQDEAAERMSASTEDAFVSAVKRRKGGA